MTETVQTPPPPPRKRILVFVLVPVLALFGLGGYLHGRAAETKQNRENFVPQVRTAIAQKLDTPVDLILPGQTEAFDSANLYPRATGYIAERRVDIGSRVDKDDLLVRIEAWTSTSNSRRPRRSLVRTRPQCCKRRPMCNPRRRIPIWRTSPNTVKPSWQARVGKPNRMPAMVWADAAACRPRSVS